MHFLQIRKHKKGNFLVVAISLKVHLLGHNLVQLFVHFFQVWQITIRNLRSIDFSEGPGRPQFLSTVGAKPSKSQWEIRLQYHVKSSIEVSRQTAEKLKLPDLHEKRKKT